MPDPGTTRFMVIGESADFMDAQLDLGRGARHRIFLEAPIRVGPGGEEAGLRQLVTVMERYVASYPDQWFNFYDFWGAPDA